MAKYIVKRVIMAIITILVVACVTFVLMMSVPGSPFNDEKITPEQKAQMEAKYGLDDPLGVQMLRYLGGIITRGDFGESLKMQKDRPVLDIITEKFPLSASIGVVALLWAIAVGIPLGCLAAYNRGKWIDSLLRVICTLGVSMPGFVVATFLLLLFCTDGGPFRFLQISVIFDPAKDGLKAYLMPCLALGVSSFVMIGTESVLSVSFTSSLARYGGDVAVGAMTVLTSINQLITMPLTGICQGGQPLISYNYGAGKLDRVKEAFYCQFGACVTYTVAFWLLLMAVPNVFAGIFTSDQALVDYTAWALRIFLACGFSVGFQISCQQAFMALGQAKISLFMACLRKLILLIPLIFLLPVFFQDKATAVFLAEPVSDIVAALITTAAFFTYFRKLLKTSARNE